VPSTPKLSMLIPDKKSKLIKTVPAATSNRIF
jgi:hypothetical protein